ncbi:nucleosome assembly protein 1-like 1 isoform X1 [Gordionus sp. m RMFG-2023]|uniref:nucleosome assembly protein 1-like 1 isoform X1 n=1 Tax=Gordionus sp. m RMFG-2023 TaxID=3053472 RepID=UPI0031FCE214
MEKGDNIISNEILKNPGLLANLQDSKDWKSSDFIKSLPLDVRRKIKALKRLHFKYSQEEAKYHKEAHELECNYYKKYQVFFDKRKNIVDGSYNPTEEECQWASDDEAGELTEKMENTSIDTNQKQLIDINQNQLNDASKESVKGIADFWLIAMQNADVLSDLIEEQDIPILKHLKDIKIIMNKDPIGYTLEFYFELNDFFTNSILTKSYEFSCNINENDTILFEGPEATKCVGCEINWKPGKNVTLRVVKKRQKHKTTGQTKMVTKSVKTESFFNFFESQEIPENINAEEMDEEMGELLADDVEIGNFIRERLVPRAVFYYTGYYTPDDDGEELSEEEDDDEEGSGDLEDDE